MEFNPFDKQEYFMLSQARIRGAFAGKRGGKTEVGAIEAIVHSEQKIGYKESAIDPYLGIIIAPTGDMLRRLSLKKWRAYAKDMIVSAHETNKEFQMHNGAQVYGISADKPQRLEGVKANWIWIDEVFQVSEALFLEAIARVSDTEGRLWCTGSLGTQYTNPKAHWAYKYFKEFPLDGSECFEWTTADNPHYPRAEIERLKDTLDPRTFRQMFEIDWSVPGTALVYDEFDDANILERYDYNPKLRTFCAIDWGWSHPMACLFLQYDPIKDTVYCFDEIVKSKMKVEQLYNLIINKPYRIDEWICDIAGNQEREQTGISNVEWFKGKGIKFNYRTSAITHGVSIIRSHIKNTKGLARFFIDKSRCPKTIDNLYNYSYPEKAGVVTSENPLKVNDDAVDALRYYFVLKHDNLLEKNPVQMIKR
jgi:PBSX family phage terminase large subunit